MLSNFFEATSLFVSVLLQPPPDVPAPEASVSEKIAFIQRKKNQQIYDENIYLFLKKTDKFLDDPDFCNPKKRLKAFQNRGLYSYINNASTTPSVCQKYDSNLLQILFRQDLYFLNLIAYLNKWLAFSDINKEVAGDRQRFIRNVAPRSMRSIWRREKALQELIMSYVTPTVSPKAFWLLASEIQLYWNYVNLFYGTPYKIKYTALCVYFEKFEKRFYRYFQYMPKHLPEEYSLGFRGKSRLKKAFELFIRFYKVCPNLFYLDHSSGGISIDLELLFRELRKKKELLYYPFSPPDSRSIRQLSRHSFAPKSLVVEYCSDKKTTGTYFSFSFS